MDEVKFEITSDNVLLTEYMQVLRNQAKEAGLDDAQLMRMSLLALRQVYPNGLPQLTWQEQPQSKMRPETQTVATPVVEQPSAKIGLEPKQVPEPVVEPKKEESAPDPLLSMLGDSMDSVTFGN